MRAGLGLILFALTISSTVVAKPKPVDNRNSALTQGNVQLNLKVGQSTKAEVLEVFGAPNITTRDGNGQEVWSYQRHATVSQSSSKSGFFTILIAGAGSKASGFSQTMRTMTLIIKFSPEDVVADFRSRTSDF